jgi:CRP-like cAMP-binding protein
VGHPPGKLLST